MYTGFSKIDNEKKLTREEWIGIVKQLGMMHILYWQTRRVEDSLSRMRARNGIKCTRPVPETILSVYDTETRLLAMLDDWEKNYKEQYSKL